MTEFENSDDLLKRRKVTNAASVTEDSGMPLWAIIVISCIAVALVVVFIIAFLIIRRNKAHHAL